MGTSTPRKDASDFDEKCRFVDAMVGALQLYGVSSQRMLDALSRVAGALGLDGEFLGTPNFVQSELREKNGRQQRVHLAVARSGGFDLAKLARVTTLAGQVEAGSVGPTEGFARLEEIKAAPPQFGRLAAAVAFVLCGASFAVILGGSWVDVLLAGVVSLASFGVSRLAGRTAGVAVLQELIAAVVAAVLAYFASVLLPGVNPTRVTVCALIVFVPGFGFTVAPSELLVGNTLSGIIWLTNAGVAAVKLFGGVALGFALAARSWPDSVPPSPVPAVWTWAAVPVLLVGLAVLFQATWRTFGAVVVGGWLVWAVVQACVPLGFWQGTFMGTVALMVYARWCGGRFPLPSVAILLPCVMILLPGVAALESLYVAQTEGVVAGMRSAYEVAILVLAIVGGNLVGEALTLGNLAKTGRVVTSLIAWPVGAGKHGDAKRKPTGP